MEPGGYRAKRTEVSGTCLTLCRSSRRCLLPCFVLRSHVGAPMVPRASAKALYCSNRRQQPPKIMFPLKLGGARSHPRMKSRGISWVFPSWRFPSDALRQFLRHLPWDSSRMPAAVAIGGRDWNISLPTPKMCAKNIPG